MSVIRLQKSFLTTLPIYPYLLLALSELVMKRADRPTIFLPSWSDEYCWVKQSSSDVHKAHCTSCNKDITISSGVTALKSHESSVVHQKNSRITAKQPNILLSFISKTAPLDTNVNNTLSAEIKWCLFLVEHKIAINASEHSGIIPSMCPDSAIAVSMKIGRTKCSYLINCVLHYNYYRSVLEMYVKFIFLIGCKK